MFDYIRGLLERFDNNEMTETELGIMLDYLGLWNNLIETDAF